MVCSRRKNRRRRWAFLLTAVVTCCMAANGLAAVAPGVSEDACEAQIPTRLKEALARRFPGLRVPLVSDNLPEDIAYDQKNGGNGCLGVAVGDFDGNGQRDYALFMTPQPSGEVLLLVALATGAEWRFSVLRRFEAAERPRLYVERGDPRKYVRSEVLDDEGNGLEPGEVRSFKSRTSCVVTGRTEASGIAYCCGPKGWVHVRISD
jgi:hypothetical protein